ncbi:hypothetical protein Tco_0370398 [Tanacetum coccineum]
MHNDIMAVGSKERPPMLTPDTPATDEHPRIPGRIVIKAYTNTTSENWKLTNAKAEAVHMISNGIGNDIYSTVDAYLNAKEMWIAIEHLQQRESINIQDVKTKLFWEFGKFTSRDRESIESYYIRFYRMMNEIVRNKLKVDSMQVNVQFLQQLQPEWSRFMTIVKNANPLALVAATQNYPNDYYQAPQAPKPYKTRAPSSIQTTLTISHSNTKSKCKEIIQKSLALIAKNFKNIYKPTNNNLKTSSNTRNKNVDTSLRTGNDRQTRQFRNQRAVTVVGKGETVGNQAKGIQLNVEQSEWLQDTYDELDEKELETHYMYMEKIQEVLHATNDNFGPTFDTEPLEKVDSNVTPNSSYMSNNERWVDLNVEEPKNERVLLASLIAKLKLDVDENKNIQKQLKNENMSLTQELEKNKRDLKDIDDLLLQEFYSKDFVCVIHLLIDDIDEYAKMACKYLEKIEECERLETELSKSHK